MKPTHPHNVGDTTSRPPRWANWLLTTFGEPDTAEEVQGDLLELYDYWVQTVGKRKADWRYSLSALNLLRPLAKSKRTSDYSSPFLLSPAMIRNYLKIAFRQLLRNRLYSLLNIGGLGIGIAVSLMILLFVVHERTYDRFHTQAEQLFRVYSKFHFGEQTIQSDRMSARFGPAIQEANAGVLDMVRISNPRSRVVIKTSPERLFFEDRFIMADPSFLRIFSFPLVAGSAKTALTRPLTVLLTERTAKRYFGQEDPIGKTITFNNKLRFEVTGILKNPPSNSTIQFDFVASLKSDPAVERLREGFINDDDVSLNSQYIQGGSYQTYFRLCSPADTAHILRTLPALITASGAKGEGTTYLFDPLTSVHLGTNFGDTTNARYLTIFSIIAAFTLLLALINYMSLTTSRATQRAREVGIRKVMGAARRSLAGQFYGESVLITGMAFGLALVLVWVLQPFFYQLMQIDIDSSFVYSTKSGMMALALFMGCVLLSGSYPALLLSSFNPVRVLKGTLIPGKGGITTRQGFIVLQFAVSVGLIGCSLLIYQQVQHLQNRKLGLYKDRMLVVPLAASLTQQYNSFKNSLRQIPGIERVAAASQVLYKEGGNIFLLNRQRRKKTLAFMYYPWTISLLKHCRFPGESNQLLRD